MVTMPNTEHGGADMVKAKFNKVEEQLVDALLVALPYVQDAQGDKGYKDGAAKKAEAIIMDALKLAGVK